MQCHRAWWAVGCCLLAAAGFFVIGDSIATAQPQPGRVYNPVTRRMEPTVGARRSADLHHAEQVRDARLAAAYGIDQPAYGGDEYYSPADCDDSCVGCGDIACGDIACGDCVAVRPLASIIYAGFEATYVKPRFEDNVAFTLMQSDGATNETFEERDFNHDLEFNPRVFLGWQNSQGVGMRVSWWQFDHAAAPISARPPANGFGAIIPPSFGTVDISSNVPTDLFTAGSDLKVYTIDIEATRQAALGCWHIGVGGGLRYAFAEQHYLAQLRDSGNDLRGEIDFRHSIEGLGPTISLDAQRDWTRTLSAFCKARGSLLYGDGESRLVAGEDLDLANSFTTTSTTGRDDLLSIAEIQLGVRWQAVAHRSRIFLPFFSIAMEGQLWNGAGSAASEDGNLGFFGFNTGAGVGW